MKLLKLSVAGLVAIGGFVPLLASPPAQAATPPNGRIAFASDADGDMDIYTVRADGAERTNLTPASGSADVQPAVHPSPFGRIAFASNRDGDMDIYTMSVAGTEVQQVTNTPGADTEPSWAPDGKRLVFTSERSGHKQIHRVHVDQPGSVAQLTSGASVNTEPAWGEGTTGERIAFVSDRDGDREVFTMGSNGSALVNATHNGVNDGQPSWDGESRILFQSKAGGDFEIVRMDMDGTDPVTLTANTVPDRQPVGSPDGAKLAYVRGPQDDAQLLVANANGSGATGVVAGGSKLEQPDWGRGFTLARRQRITNVTAQRFGTRLVIRFDTTLATDHSYVEVWNGPNLARLVFETGQPTTHHQLQASSLPQGTAFTVKVFAPRPNGDGNVAHTIPGTVSTLTRRVDVTWLWADVINDGDEDSCGDVRVFMKVHHDGTYDHVYTPQSEEAEICGGTWNPPDKTVTLDDVDEDDLPLEFLVWEDDSVACGIFDNCLDVAQGWKSLEVYRSPEAFTETTAVHLYPTDGEVEMVWHYRLMVSYH